MPQLYSAITTTTDLKRGDITAYGEVANVDRKVKWATVTFTNGSTDRVLLNEQWGVTRSRPTPEEEAASRLEGKLFFLDMSEQRAAKDFADAKRRVTEAIASDDWNIASRTQDLLIAKAVNELWRRVAITHLRHATTTELEPITRIEAYTKVLERAREEVLEFSRWSSRSTSTWSNAVEDIELDVKSRFIRDAKWNIEL